MTTIRFRAALCAALVLAACTSDPTANTPRQLPDNKGAGGSGYRGSASTAGGGAAGSGHVVPVDSTKTAPTATEDDGGGAAGSGHVVSQLSGGAAGSGH